MSLFGIVPISITTDTRSVVIIILTTIFTIITDTNSITVMIIMVVTRCSLAYSAARPASGSISGVRNKQGLFTSH